MWFFLTGEKPNGGAGLRYFRRNYIDNAVKKIGSLVHSNASRHQKHGFLSLVSAIA